MAESFYKSLHPNRDIVSTRTLLHEAIPLTGTIPSGTYAEENIKNYTHGMFQSVYDYPYLSSSANHIFDITAGVSSKSPIYSSITTQQKKKVNLYNQHAQVFVGYDVTGGIRRFDQFGDVNNESGTKMDAVYFLNFARLLTKDEIKKGSFEMEIGVSKEHVFGQGVMAQRLKITDYSGSNEYFTNSPAGEYGILYATQSAGPQNVLDANQYYAVGLIYYQSGLVVLTGSCFHDTAQGGILHATDADSTELVLGAGNDGLNILTGSSISGSADGLRNRIYNLQFNNTVELNSTIYFCRVHHNEFNYSTNQTYLTGSQLRVKEKATDVPVSYITTVGLYNDNNELLAVAKLSEPLKKDPSTEMTIRVRLDY